MERGREMIDTHWINHSNSNSDLVPSLHSDFGSDFGSDSDFWNLSFYYFYDCYLISRSHRHFYPSLDCSILGPSFYLHFPQSHQWTSD